MTQKELERRLDEIKQMIWDDEAAHGLLDALYIDVLKAIASGTKNSRMLASLVLVAEDFNFNRWRA